MTLSLDGNIYSHLFDDEGEKNYEYFNQLYSNPVDKGALLEILKSTSLRSQYSETTNYILKKLLDHGVNRLSELVDYSQEVLPKSSTLKPSYNTNSDPFPTNHFLDIEGEDITTLNKKTPSEKNRSSAKKVIDFEGDDITTLHRTFKGPKNDLSSDSLINNTKHLSLNEDIDNDDLISNIIQILHVWFQNISECNKHFYRKKNILGKETTLDLLANLFSTDLDIPQNIKNFGVLLAQLKLLLNSSLKKIPIELKENSLSIIRDTIYLLAEILKTICWSLGMHTSSSNEFVIIKSLLFSFYSVDFFPTIDDIFSLTSYKFENNKPILPNLRLSPKTLITLYKLASVLSSMPDDFMPENFENGNCNDSIYTQNIYDIYIRNKEFNLDEYHQQVYLRIVPYFATDFNFYYNFKPDLMRNKNSNTSFVKWITGNFFGEDNYNAYRTVEQVTNMNENFQTLSIIQRKDDPFLLELQKVYDERIQSLKDLKDLIDTYDILTITLMLRNFCKNSSFKDIFLNVDKSEGSSLDVLPNEDRSVHLFEIWLTIISYNYQYQYSSKYLQAVTKVSLLLILELIEESDSTILIEALSNLEINELKWKLCHQKEPIIPISTGKKGYKSGIFYILDVLQVLLRFNLTRKLEVENFRLAILIAYKLIGFLHDNLEQNEVGTYVWSEFYKTIINLLLFIKKQNLVNYKHFLDLDHSESIKALTEELLLLINLLLSSKFTGVLIHDVTWEEPRAIIYHLIYEIFYNWEIFNDLVTKDDIPISKNFDNILVCLNFYKATFYTKISKDREGQPAIEEMDYESPLLVKILLDCVSLLHKSTSATYDKNRLVFSSAFSFLEVKLPYKHINNTTMVKIINIVFNTGYEKL